MFRAFPRQAGQLLLFVVLLGANDDRAQEALEVLVHAASLDVGGHWNLTALDFLKVKQEAEQSLGRINLIATLEGHVQVLLLAKHLLMLLEHRVLSICLLLLFSNVYVA